MGLSPAQLLKRKEKKKKARKEKAKTIYERSQLHNLSAWPIVSAYAPFHSKNDYTMLYGLIVRRCPNGDFAAGIFLIDLLCLGVKDCFMKIVSPHQFSILLGNIESILPIDEVSPSYVATLIHKVVEYSKNLGFEPHENYEVVKQLLAGIPLDHSLTFTFGENGQPVYVAGPRDSQEFSNRVLETLNKAVGENNFKFIVSTEICDVMKDY